MTQYNKMELMICAASRQMEDGKIVAVGTGAPCAAAMVAQKVHAPNLIMGFEAGGFAPILPTMPISVGDSRTFYKGLSASTMIEIMSAAARGFVDYCFLGGAQIDMYGNLNSTIIGPDYEHFKVRLPGSGGANDFASFCWNILVITPHDKRRFVPKVDFLTTPGYLSGKGAREAAGLAAGSGPYKIITDLAIMGFDKETCRMKVESLHPGVTRQDVIDNTGFEMLFADEVGETQPPTERELQVLREEVDPNKYIIGRG